VHPIALNLGSLPIRWYGVMMALAFLACLWTATRRARLANVSSEVIADVTLWVMVGSIIGARFVYVTTYWKQEFSDQPFREVFMIQHGGLVFYGGLIGASLACIAYVRLKKLPLWKVADILTPSVPLGCFFGRIGCLLNGCCYGRACNLPWAIRFPADNPLGPPTYPVHPTEIYDSLLNLCLYAFLAWLYRRKKFDGQVFGVYLVCYAVLRSFVETFRGDYPEHQHYLGGWATPAHLVSIMIFITGLYLVMGGYFAVAVSDFIRGIVEFLGVVTMVLLLAAMKGGLGATFAALLDPKYMPALSAPPPPRSKRTSMKWPCSANPDRPSSRNPC